MDVYSTRTTYKYALKLCLSVQPNNVSSGGELARHGSVGTCVRMRQVEEVFFQTYSYYVWRYLRGVPSGGRSASILGSSPSDMNEVTVQIFIFDPVVLSGVYTSNL